jgi:hypothetical protein
VILAVVILAAAAFLIGFGTRHRQTAPAAVSPPPAVAASPSAASFTGIALIQGDSQGHPAPVATRSIADLQRWLASPGNGSTDSPARVRLYLSNRIMLVSPGAPARILGTHGEWRRIEVLDGLHRGATGYINARSLTAPNR